MEFLGLVWLSLKRASSEAYARVCCAILSGREYPIEIEQAVRLKQKRCRVLWIENREGRLW